MIPYVCIIGGTALLLFVIGAVKHIKELNKIMNNEPFKKS